MKMSPLAAADDAAQRCAEAISRIRSYDVTASIQDMSYAYPYGFEKTRVQAAGQIINSRDVLAFGFGRRVESFLGTQEQITSVIDWQTAARQDKVSNAISCPFADVSYLDFFNPNVAGFFLSELMRDKDSVVTTLARDLSLKVSIGFEVTNPKVPGRVRVWPDPQHGNMPALIEVFTVSKKGKTVLDGRTRIEEFMHLQDGSWVPVKGFYESFANVVANAGKKVTEVSRAVRGETLTVDVKRSTWNSIRSGDLFSGASMPEANLRRDGWREHYPANILAEIKKAAKMFIVPVSDAFAAKPPCRTASGSTTTRSSSRPKGNGAWCNRG
jgi:hypothetical protein